MSNIGDVIRTTLGKPAKSDAPEELASQVRPPTSEEMAEIENIATEAARLQDELRAVDDDRPARLRKLVGELKIRMLAHGLTDVVISGRPPIELGTTNNRKPTRKGIIAAFQDLELEKLTEEQRRDTKLVKEAESKGKQNGLNFWNRIEPTTSHSVKIPDPTPPEVESPY